MRHTLERLPELSVPAGHELRSLEPTDIDAWVALLNDNAELGAWTHERAVRYFGPQTAVVLADSFFVMCGATPVATAQLELHADDVYTPLGELGWVAVSPAFRGRGLGYLVCLAVLQRAATRNLQVFLRTDDHRYPAIATYLRLGFEPWLRDPTAETRWRSVLRQLRAG
jgi:mycothiol synthase